MEDSQDEMLPLPAALMSRPSVRRASVFSDLMTIFRRSTGGSSHHPNLNRTRRAPGVLRGADGVSNESEAFLGADACAAGQNGHADEEEEGKPMTRQVLLDKIRQKKEVIGKLRCQPWSMNRKRRTLKLAQKYLEDHESRVSKTHLYKEELTKRWRSACRWFENIRIYLIPWEAKIKRIESHFGSVVSSYFTFLRWVVYINVIITLIVVSFIVIPEVLADATADQGRKNRTNSRKVIPADERIHADELHVTLHFDGYFKYSPLFYGYYSNEEFVGDSVHYGVPLAYFIITLLVFGYSFFVILRKMAANARSSKLASGKTEQYVFNWKVYTGWDFTIGNPDTASNSVMATINKLRESIAESRITIVKKFQVILFLVRVFANAVILGMLAFSIYVISFAVQSSRTVEKTGSLFTKNQVPTIVATITHLFPMIFDLIGTMERYHPKTALRAHLTRVLVLYVVNYLTLIIALFEKMERIRGDEINKILEGRQSISRFKRHSERENSVLPPLAPFVSRNFTSEEQARMFVDRSIARFGEKFRQTAADRGAQSTAVRDMRLRAALESTQTSTESALWSTVSSTVSTTVSPSIWTTNRVLKGYSEPPTAVTESRTVLPTTVLPSSIEEAITKSMRTLTTVPVDPGGTTVPTVIVTKPTVTSMSSTESAATTITETPPVTQTISSRPIPSATRPNLILTTVPAPDPPLTIAGHTATPMKSTEPLTQILAPPKPTLSTVTVTISSKPTPARTSLYYTFIPNPSSTISDVITSTNQPEESSNLARPTPTTVPGSITVPAFPTQHQTTSHPISTTLDQTTVSTTVPISTSTSTLASTTTAGIRTKRTTTTSRRLPPGSITIQPQYGPVALNNPHAWLFNQSAVQDTKRFQTIKIGPKQLPVFTPPPTPSRPPFQTNVDTEVGPDWSSLGKKKKITTSPRVNTTRWPSFRYRQRLKTTSTQPPTTSTAPTVPTASTVPPTVPTRSTMPPTEKTTLRTTDSTIAMKNSASKEESSSPMVTPSAALPTVTSSGTLPTVTPSGVHSTTPDRVPALPTESLTSPLPVTSAVTTPTPSPNTVSTVSEGTTVTKDTVGQGEAVVTSLKNSTQTTSRADGVLAIDTASNNSTQRKMIVLSPDEELVQVSNDNDSLAIQSHDNDTYYEIGDLARITTEESQAEEHFCWETMIGQEIVKLVTMDLVMTIASIFVIDFFRGIWIKYCSSWWCWDIETTFPEYGEFKVAENVLHIIYNQGLIWLGLFFSPLLPAMNNVKLIILMYIRAWACMTCNVPAREIFRASRSSNFYLLILLLWLLLCTLPVGYVIASKRPSSTCGPFAGHERFYYVLTQMIEGRLDKTVVGWLQYVASPGVIIPVLLLLMLIIYFLVSLVRGLREANTDLQQQLVKERTEEKKKIFELAGGANRKKTSEGMKPDKKKKVVTYLPLVEQKRREPWRAYNELEYDSSVCLTDETSTATTPASTVPSPQFLPRPKPSPVPPPPTTTLSSHPLGSVVELDREESAGTSSESRTETDNVVTSLPKSRATDRSRDWLNDEETSDQSYDVQSGAIELATPDEIRRSGGLKPRPISIYQQPGVHHSLDPILAAETEKEREEEESFETEGEPEQVTPLKEEDEQSSPPIEGDEQATSFIKGDEQATPFIKGDEQATPHISREDSDKSMGSKRRFHQKRSTTTFVPWPSIDEMKDQRSKLTKVPPQFTSPNSRPSRRISPPKRIQTLEGSPTKQETPLTSSHQRRFRISVSPTRRFQTDPSGSDTDTSTGKRRFVIKQEVMAGSMASVATMDANRTRPSSPVAPLVQFDMDDSPGSLRTPSTDPSVHSSHGAIL